MPPLFFCLVCRQFNESWDILHCFGVFWNTIISCMRRSPQFGTVFSMEQWQKRGLQRTQPLNWDTAIMLLLHCAAQSIQFLQVCIIVLKIPSLPRDKCFQQSYFISSWSHFFLDGPTLPVTFCQYTADACSLVHWLSHKGTTGHVWVEWVKATKRNILFSYLFTHLNMKQKSLVM